MLPACQHRGPANDQGRYPCACPQLTVAAAGVTEFTCRVCPDSDDPPKRRAIAAGAAGGVCKHRGAATGELLECSTCQGAVQVKVFACALYGKCTLAKPAQEIRACASCRDFQAK